MAEWLSVILEIVKLTVPALIVYFTVSTLLRQYLENQHKIKLIELKDNQQATTTPLRLQAYERLSLFCERITIPNLIVRMRKEGMSAAQLRLSMLLAIQTEYEHNITQQVYVSDQLWQIIKIARDDSVNIINLVAEPLPPNATADELAKQLFEVLEKREITALDKALVAIKKEAGILM